MSNEAETKTAVEWFYDKIKSHFEHDGDLLETIIFTMAIAKKKERELMEEVAHHFYRQGFFEMESDHFERHYKDYLKQLENEQ
jgi:hypothetical protein